MAWSPYSLERCLLMVRHAMMQRSNSAMKSVFRVCLCLVVLILTDPNRVRATATCTNSHCLYFSFVSRPILPIAVAEQHNGSNRASQYALVGTVTTTVSATAPVIVVRAYDGLGQLLGTGTGTTWLPNVLPGQPNPFSIVVPGTEQRTVTQVEAQVISYNLIVNQTYISLTTVLTLGATSATALIRNDSPYILKNVEYLFYSWRLFFSYCNGGGASGSLEGNLKSGQAITLSFPYCFDPSNSPPSYYEYRIIAQGLAIR